MRWTSRQLIGASIVAATAAALGLAGALAWWYIPPPDPLPPQPLSLGDYIWADANGDKNQAGESGIGSVTVNLYDDTTDALVASTTTLDSSYGAYEGEYRFYGLSVGTAYRVEVDTGTLPNPAATRTTGAWPVRTFTSNQQAIANADIGYQ